MSKENGDQPIVYSHMHQYVDSSQQSTGTTTSIIRASQIPALQNPPVINSLLPQSFANSNELMGALRNEVLGQVREDLRINGLMGMVTSEEFWRARVNWTTELVLCQNHSDQRVSELTSTFTTQLNAKAALLTELYSEIEKLTSQVENEKSCHNITQQKFDDVVLERNDVIKKRNKIIEASNNFELMIGSMTLSTNNMLDGNEDEIDEKSSQEKRRSRRVIIQDLKDCREKISVLLADLKMVKSKLEELSLANRKEIASLEEDKAKLKVEIDDISSQLIEAEKQLASQRQTISGYGDTTSALEKERDSLRERCTTVTEQLKLEKDDISSKLIDAEEQLASQRQTISSYGDITSALEKERDSLRERCTAVTEQLESLQKNFFLSLEERVKKVVNELSGKPSSEEVLQELSECREKITNLQAEISDIKQLSEADQQEILRLKEINFELEDAKGKLLTSEEKSTTSNIAIKADLGSVSKELASLQERYNAMEAHSAGKEEELTLSAARNIELHQTVEDLKSQLQKEIDLKFIASREADERSQELALKADSVTSLQERYNAMEAHSTGKEKELTLSAARNVELQETVENLKRRLQEETRLKNKARREAHERSQQLAASNEMIEGKSKTISALQNQVTSLNQTVVRLRHRLESVSQLSKESNPKSNKEAERDQYELMVSSLKKMTVELSSTMEQLETTRSELESCQQSKRIAQHYCKTWKKQLTDAKLQLNKMKTTMDDKLKYFQKTTEELFYQVEAQLKTKQSALDDIAHLNNGNIDARPQLNAKKPPMTPHPGGALPHKRSGSNTSTTASVTSSKKIRFSPGSKKQTPKNHRNMV